MSHNPACGYDVVFTPLDFGWLSFIPTCVCIRVCVMRRSSHRRFPLISVWTCSLHTLLYISWPQAWIKLLYNRCTVSMKQFWPTQFKFTHSFPLSFPASITHSLPPFLPPAITHSPSLGKKCCKILDVFGIKGLQLTTNENQSILLICCHTLLFVAESKTFPSFMHNMYLTLNFFISNKCEQD